MFLSSSRCLLSKITILKSTSVLSYLISSSSQSLLKPLKASQHSFFSPTITFRVSFCSHPLNLDEAQVSASIDYQCGLWWNCRSLLEEDEYHKLADSTIHDLQEKFEEYGDCSQVDSFDIDYGVRTIVFGLQLL
ncbi:hypothetical protein IFM89_024604 [Coptis chinensis]|uniref:Uncharacterized protein n=1 Tax=Coptis chinensis TaxID=261450 RepID=A0A835LWE3_9MAGN|nr:hypothetical protein IFM89_024604 [Coptis chinensis]